MKRVIVSDIDGTILKGGSQEFSKENKEVFKKIKDNGDIFIFSSGRHYGNIHYMYGKDDDTIYNVENGSLIVYKGEILKSFTLYNDDGYKIIKYLYKYIDKLNILVSTSDGEGYYLVKDKVYYGLNRCKTYENIDSFDKFISLFDPKNIIKISYQRDQMDDFFFSCYNYLKANFKDIEVFDSNNTRIDISPKNINKGSSLKYILDYFKLNDLPLYCFGDAENDLSMLKIADYSYAPDTALKVVKDEVDFIYKDFNHVILSFYGKE